MGLNSCLYSCDVMHSRLQPKKNKFAYKIFMFSLDLDEIDALNQKLRLFSRNHFNLFNFRDRDHMEEGSRSTKENILEYVRSRGVSQPVGRVTLITHLRTLGYIFNPVSFYFCFGTHDEPVCAVVEVGNTFREMKRYFLGPETFQDGRFYLRTTKYFYVSPYIDLDAEFEFKLPVPGNSLNVYIDDWQGEKKFLLTSLTGARESLTDLNLAWFTFRFPFITLKVIFLIHWQAFILYLKRLPHLKKAANPQLQQEVYHAKSHS